MFSRRFTCFMVLILAQTAWADERLTFEEHIRPIFRAHCYDCHGAEAEVKGGLDLRLVRFMSKGGDSGPAIVAGRTADSFLLDRIRSGEMPPGEHRVPAEQISVIEQWILQGARTARPEPDSIGPGLGITPEERSFWSFQPIRRPDVREIKSFPPDARVRTAIDALILSAMPEGAAFAKEADRRTLIRRVYFDLTGLPPSPEQMETWARDSASDWYERLIDELLDSPHYGERWARHWLDVAGYADSEGYTNSDAERPWAWKYRDWVIKAFNEDKPFNQFVIEQLAGDELSGPQDGDLTQQQIDLLTATGFLRMAADGTGSGANNAEARNQVMTDTLKIVGTSLLGLSLQCAQCHDHRYDPIPQTDYYAVRAVFEPALDWQSWKVPNSRRVSLFTKADREKSSELESQTKPIAAERATKLAEYMKQALEKELTKYPEPLRTQLRTAYETAGDKRTAEQKGLLAKNPSVNITPGNLYQYIAESKGKLAEYDKKMADIRAKKPVEEFLRALVEPANHAPQTKLFYRGDHQQPKQAIAPGPLSVAAADGQRPEFTANSADLPSTGRRLAFARWLTDGRHPLVARVIVNRLWLHHFGSGLVNTPADFGRLGAKPTHPELLDWLADEFMAQGWSIKQFHRMVLTSTVWRQSAEKSSGSTVPFGRRRLQRLDAETIRDRMLAASGQLDPALYGRPVAIKLDDTGQVIVNGDQRRRSLYVKVRRSQPVAMLQAFDAPVMQTNCELRPKSTVATQSLMLMNGEFTLGQAGRLAERAAREAQPVAQKRLAALPVIPQSRVSKWECGYGAFNAESQTCSFTPFPFFNGSWQGGEKLPDAQLGWAFLSSTGGHTQSHEISPIRRWTVPHDGMVRLSGKLHHPSENGDGVHGRIVSSSQGLLGEWTAKTGSAETNVSEFAVRTGDTIDFITDCRANHTSDSFTWTASLTYTSNGRTQTLETQKEFHGPAESPAQIAGQIERIWQLALCRLPEPGELSLAMQFTARQIDTFRREAVALPDNRTPSRQALTNLCQALFSSNEFLYID